MSKCKRTKKREKKVIKLKIMKEKESKIKKQSLN